jgi:hypothetical protein
MKKVRLAILLLLFSCLMSSTSIAQCSICTKTAQQLGETTGRGLNRGIIYLALAPLAIVGIIGYRWWKNNSKESEL